MEEKNGLFRLGFVVNHTSKEGRPSCYEILSRIINKQVTIKDLNKFIESEEFDLEYFNLEKEKAPSESEAFVKRFALPYKDRYGGTIYGEFRRNALKSNFAGVFWYSTSISSLEKYGKINPSSIDAIREESQEGGVKESNVFDYVVSEAEYFNGAGYKQSNEGRQVKAETGKFIRFKTNLKAKSGNPLFIWFTKNTKGAYEGLDCGDEVGFKQSLSSRESFFSGRMSFASIEKCKEFFNELARESMKEPWNFKKREGGNFDCPILKSYLECELDRLFYEYEVLCKDDKIVFNDKKDKICFDTNLLDKFAHELRIVGDVVSLYTTPRFSTEFDFC